MTRIFSSDRIDINRVRYPHCIVWTPIPLLTWLFLFIGHMGIARTGGVIRDLAGPYYVSVSLLKNCLLIDDLIWLSQEDDMAFDRPTRYFRLDLNRIPTTSSSNNSRAIWDISVEQASDEYTKRMVMKIISLLLFKLFLFLQHNLCFDICHSHVAMAFTIMNYDRKHSYDMISSCFWIFFRGKLLGKEIYYPSSFHFSYSNQFRWFSSYLVTFSHSSNDYRWSYHLFQSTKMLLKPINIFYSNIFKINKTRCRTL